MGEEVVGRYAGAPIGGIGERVGVPEQHGLVEGHLAGIVRPTGWRIPRLVTLYAMPEASTPEASGQDRDQGDEGAGDI